MTALTDDQQELYDEIVRRAAAEARGDHAAVLAAYARAGFDPGDVEAVRSALLGNHRPLSRDATWSLTLGLLALVCPVPGVGLGAVWSARRARRETQGGFKSGEGMATAGEILGWLTTAAWGVTAVALMIAAVR